MMAEIGSQEQLRKLQFSVKKDDAGDNITFIIPYWHYTGVALPPRLPSYEFSDAYYRQRDQVLLSTPRFEAMWADALGIAVSKQVSLAWEIESDVPLRRKRAQEWLLNAGAGLGIFGWVPFLSSHLQAFFGTGLAFVEIERATPANGSKVINIHHLNPLRCRLTGDSQKPVRYMAKDGKVRALNWHQVLVFPDMLDPSEGENGAVIPAAERAYSQIIKLAAMENYVYEKISGQRPLALYFIGGAIQRHINDAIDTAEQDARRKQLQSYMGAAVTALPGDVPLSLITIPLAELPDGFDAEQERLRADLIYANALGLDPQDLNPNLVGRQGLGSTGNQSLVLAEKSKGRGLAAWKQQFQHQINELALDDKTLFTFQEEDLRDKAQEAENAKLRAETRKLQIESGEISADEARNLAVDEGDLPREFIEQDITGGDSISDTDKPETEEEESETESERPTAQERIQREQEKARQIWQGLY